MYFFCAKWYGINFIIYTIHAFNFKIKVVFYVYKEVDTI